MSEARAAEGTKYDLIANICHDTLASQVNLTTATAIATPPLHILILFAYICSLALYRA